jgi:hypothetical protein
MLKYIEILFHFINFIRWKCALLWGFRYKPRRVRQLSALLYGEGVCGVAIAMALLKPRFSRSQTLFTALSLALTLNPSPKLGEGL